jgi:hypothetical protein
MILFFYNLFYFILVSNIAKKKKSFVLFYFFLSCFVGLFYSSTITLVIAINRSSATIERTCGQDRELSALVLVNYRFFCLYTDASVIELKCITLKRTPLADNTSIGAHTHSRHHHWQISAPALNPT